MGPRAIAGFGTCSPTGRRAPPGQTPSAARFSHRHLASTTRAGEKYAPIKHCPPPRAFQCNTRRSRDRGARLRLRLLVAVPRAPCSGGAFGDFVNAAHHRRSVHRSCLSSWPSSRLSCPPAGLGQRAEHSSARVEPSCSSRAGELRIVPPSTAGSTSTCCAAGAAPNGRRSCSCPEGCFACAGDLPARGSPRGASSDPGHPARRRSKREAGA